MKSTTFYNLLVIIMIIYIIYIAIREKVIQSEQFEDALQDTIQNTTSDVLLNLPPKLKILKSNKECSNVSINEAIFTYSLSKLNQIKTPN